MIYCLINENRKICRISPVFRWRCCPPPIQKLENISRLLNTNVYIKRDDLTGIGLGGNKIRKLEFLLADTKRKGAEVVFTTGGAQSNHAMLTAACAKKLGMEPILILKKRGVTERKATSCWSWTSRPRRRTSASSICAALATPSPLPRATPPSA